MEMPAAEQWRALCPTALLRILALLVILYRIHREALFLQPQISKLFSIWLFFVSILPYGRVWVHLEQGLEVHWNIRPSKIKMHKDRHSSLVMGNQRWCLLSEKPAWRRMYLTSSVRWGSHTVPLIPWLVTVMLAVKCFRSSVSTHLTSKLQWDYSDSTWLHASMCEINGIL